MELLLDNIRSGNNIGSIFRTADALGVKKIWLTGICALPPNREVLKTALGACDSVNWEYRESATLLCEELKQSGYTLLALEQGPERVLLQDYQFDQSTTCVVLGNEVEGVNPDILKLVDKVLEIPQFGIKKSLNVAVSAGMLLWQWKWQQLKRMKV